MADDHTQRPPYRSSESIARSAPAIPSGSPAGPAPGASSSSDPLAELARLIGQTDPFSEYGRASARTPATPIAPPPGQPRMPTLPPMSDIQPFNPPSFARQQFGGPPLDEAHDDLYPVEGDDPRYAEPHADAHDGAHDSAHDDDPYHPSNAQFGSEHGDFYEDVPPSRRRTGIMVVAGAIALAAMGSAGAFGYRALFNTTPSAPPPVIKAESAPSKIVPASNKDAPSKQITDRVDATSQSEKLVSREEKPVEIKDQPAGAVFPPSQTPSSSSSPAPGSGVVSSDAKRVRTIVIRPDQATIADSTPTVAPPRATTSAPVKQAAAPAAPAAPPQQQPTPPRNVSNLDDPESVSPPAPPAQRQSVPRAAAVPAPSNAPLSLSPNAPAPAPARVAPARAAAPAARAAAVAPTQELASAATSEPGGSYTVQVSSHPSEAEAQTAFRALQGKYPGQLGGKQPIIRKVDLGAKGIYYRAMVGPFATGNEARELCSSLKAAGGQCIIQRN